MITIHKSGTDWAIPPEELFRLQHDFKQNHFIRLPNLIQADLLEEIYSQIQRSHWEERIHDGIGVEICLDDPGTVALINFLLNDQQLFQIVQTITGCEPIGCFQGRVYRMIPGSGHYDSWHTDVGEDRLLALSLNLGKEVYQGGLLQIQQRHMGDKLIEAPNPHFGHAILFRLSDELRHRVTNVEGVVPKTAFAGWFKSSPDLSSTLTELFQTNQS
jgi:hypothetical protein